MLTGSNKVFCSADYCVELLPIVIEVNESKVLYHKINQPWKITIIKNQSKENHLPDMAPETDRHLRMPCSNKIYNHVWDVLVSVA